MLDSDHLDAVGPSVAESLLAAIVNEIRSIRGESAGQPLSPETPLWQGQRGDQDDATELGLDSLDLLELFVRLEARLGIQVPDDFDLATCGTVGDVVQLLASRPLIR
jgi:acyl carrier protein